MKIIIVGGGASGLLASIAIKKKHSDYDVLVIDKNEKLGRKLRATGNGRCNLGNLSKITYQYSNNEEANNLFKEYSIDKLINFLKELNIEVTSEENYLYPYSKSSNTFTDQLIERAKELGVKFILNTTCIDYKNGTLKTNNGDFKFDKLIIASGLKSDPKLGSDDSFIINLKNHGYVIDEIKPGLVPIKIKENVKDVVNIRAKVNVKVVDKNKIYFDEDGELIFKKDALSGIVIFNASNFINHFSDKKLMLKIDFLPNKKCELPIDAYFEAKLANFLKQFKDIKNVMFTPIGTYDFSYSQVSLGGVSFKNINKYYESLLEKNIFFLGECLSIFGICGGYNLMWCFLQAIKLSDII